MMCQLTKTIAMCEPSVRDHANFESIENRVFQSMTWISLASFEYHLGGVFICVCTDCMN